MALVDPDTNQLVVRILYDGPAFAGKTTSLKRLAASLGGEIFSAEEADGRTLFFDWVDYVGGRFEGMPIRCQIVSVPGQQILVKRRRLLLETADAAVFVLDSRRSARAESQRSFAVLREVVGKASPPFGIVVQANKRDLPDLSSLDEIRSALGEGRTIAMTETIAERGEGVRETFVLAVRLALDRVRFLWTHHELPRLKPTIDSGFSLLTTMQDAEEQDAAQTVASIGLGSRDRRGIEPALEELFLPDPVDAPGRNAPAGAPLPPDASVPPGLVWPPVEGRVVLFEAMRVPPEIEALDEGAWTGRSREWRLRSPGGAQFRDLEEGRAALVSWARWHTAAGARLSPQRCVVLARAKAEESPGADQGGQDWRLWQIVRRTPSLEDICRDLIAQAEDHALGEGLLRAAALRIRAEHDLRQSGWLHRLDLQSVGTGATGNPIFTRYAPFPAEIPQPSEQLIDEETIVRKEFGPLLRRELSHNPRRLPGVLSGLRAAGSSGHRARLAELLQSLLLEA
jgi:signal recognition particle receptor subunit beta